jgi:hypothetical protein
MENIGLRKLSTNLRNAFGFSICLFACFSALGAAVCAGQKMDKKASCLSAASFDVFPFFVLHKREPRRGSVSAVAFFCLLFFADAKKSE